MQKLAEKFYSLFKGNMHAHGLYVLDLNMVDHSKASKIQGRATTVRDDVTVNLWEGHLSGKKGIGIIPITEESECSFGAIDIDVYPLDAEAICQAVNKLNMPLIACRSKSGGLHLYTFTAEPVTAKLMQDKLRSWAITLGYGTSEVFPKQTKVLTERGDVGGWINMPYFDIEGSNKRIALFPDATPMTALEFLEEAGKKRLSAEEFEALEILITSELPEGPPCLQKHIVDKVGSGGRNTILSNMVTYVQKMGATNPEEYVLDLNHRYFDPPLEPSEVRLIVKSRLRKDYNYSCKDENLAIVCDRPLCITRKFGVAKTRFSETQDFLEGLQKYNSDPPIWFVSIRTTHGTARIEVTGEELLSQSKFKLRCMNTTNLILSPIPKDKWEEKMRKLLETVQVVEATEDTTIKGRLMETLETFCLGRNKALTLDEIMMGKPFTEGGYHFFRYNDFTNYLSRMKFNEIKNPNQISNYLLEKGGVSMKTTIRGKPVLLWKFPEFTKVEIPYALIGISAKEVM